MSSRSLFDNPTVPRLLTVLEEVRSGNLLIPDFQRPFEWDDDRRLLLLDSVSKGMPIGSFLVWRTRKSELKSYKSIGPFKLDKEPVEGEVRSYLLDGHQRLTTLFSALTETTTISPENNAVRWPVYYDLSANRNEQAFTFRRGRAAPKPTWVPLSVLLAPRELYAFQKGLMDKGLFREAERAEALANAFKDYQIPIIPLVTDDLDVVTDSFVRVNNQGKPMQETHMIRALSYSSMDIREKLNQIRQRLAPLGWSELEDQVFVNTLKARWELDIYKAGPRELNDHLSRSDKNFIFDELEANTRQAVQFLATCGVGGPRSLPYAYQLVAIIEALRRITRHLSPSQKEALRIWFWATTYTGYFTGITSNRIRDSIDDLFHILTDNLSPLPVDLSRQVQPLENFNFNSTRSKAFALLLVNQIKEKGFRERTARILGITGSSAVERLFPEEASEDPANRVVALSDELGRLRKVVTQNKPLSESNSALLSRYSVPTDSAPLFRVRDPQYILEERRLMLSALEARFIKDLGLDPYF
ncbi:DUF262 domain-containing protein [Corallococcus sp. AB038B]|uniref:DUF262 domain-containing protein n=1 Tax=Corallococcus sp. AB038B TaxID=2316718 RepID=UPI000ED05A1F|nr:DUF262 domain-containing protein [Corallococcus sp. AB038B]RKH95287.1 DUF262 domain-containing protein [Corallococcus sp. AB038B]